MWVSTTNPPRNYTTADFAQMLADSTGYNASIVFRNLQANSTFHTPHGAHDTPHTTRMTRHTV